MTVRTKGSLPRVLLFAFHFPPDNASGAARPNRFFKYLPEFGYQPEVITAASLPNPVAHVHSVPAPTRFPSKRTASGVLEIVLENLVGNALNYLEDVPDRRVTIDVTSDESEVTTVVADTGPGLPPDADMASLFEPYVRGQEARSIGLGLGLATVKRIVDAHGGRTGVRSSAKGCQFWFSLPAIAG